MAVCFLVLAVLAQAAFLLVARQTAEAAAEAAARAAARPGASPAAEADELFDQLVAAVPGAVDPSVEVSIEDELAVATVTFGWVPPGPDLVPVRITVVGRAPLVVSP
jgi:hypothetical protein